MARLRTLKPQFFKDPDLAELPIAARMFYAGLWCQADREGRLRDEPKLLKVEIAPWDDVDAEEMLGLLSRPRENKPGFIVRYAVGGRRYICIPRFSDHQKPSRGEVASKIPPPPSDVAPKQDSNPAQARLELDPDPAQEDRSSVFGLGSSGLGEDPPVAPRQEPRGADVVPIRQPKLRTRKRHTEPNLTLAQEQRFRRDEQRDTRSKALFGELERRRRVRDLVLRDGGPAPPEFGEDEQLAWVQENCACTADEAWDACELVRAATRAAR